MKSAAIVLLIAVAQFVAAEDKPLAPPDPFTVIFIDEAVEKSLGPFPYDRAVYARAIDKLADAKVRGVVLKFFIDQPKSKEGDAALAAAIKRTKVILQARLDDTEPKPNPLPERFRLATLKADSKALSGKSGWIPLPALADVAHDIAFLDSAPSVELAPMIERYQGTYVKSLYLAALELATNEQAVIKPAESIQLGKHIIKIDDRCMARITLPQADTLAAHSLLDLINDKIPADHLKDRVIILGYDGAKMERNKTPIGPVKGHRLFCYQLFSLYRGLGDR